MREAVGLLLLVCASYSSAARQFELNFAHSTNKIVVTDFYYELEYAIFRGRKSNPPDLEISTFPFGISDEKKIQSVSLGTGQGGFIRERRTPKGFILSGRGDEIEFAIEVDDRDYAQLKVSRKNIR